MEMQKMEQSQNSLERLRKSVDELIERAVSSEDQPAEAPEETEEPAAPVKQAAAPAPAKAVAPQVEAGIPGDVVAAIMAAIYSMGNGKYVLKAVRRGKNGWGKAGVNDTTAPF